MLGLMSTEVEIHPLRLHGLDPSYRGHDGVRGWFDEIARQQHRHLIQVAELVEISDDRVLSDGQVVVRNQTVMPFSGLYSFDAEAIVELHHYFTSSSMLGRLGVLGAGEGRPAGRDEGGLVPYGTVTMGLMHAETEVTAMIDSGAPFDAIDYDMQQIPDLVDEERSRVVAVRVVAPRTQLAAVRRDTAPALGPSTGCDRLTPFRGRLRSLVKGQASARRARVMRALISNSAVAIPRQSTTTSTGSESRPGT